ncbi:MAG: LytTR family DNA-binding domain-containing protein, partial [Bacteroidota bacterium]
FFVPRYFNREKWYLYILHWIILFAALELVRTLLFMIFMDGSHQHSFLSELTSNNSLIFGRLNFITYNMLFWSLFYRFLLDRFTERVPKQEKIPTPTKESLAPVQPLPTQQDEPAQNLIFKKGKEEVILEVKEVVYFQAQGDFVLAVDTEGRKYVINKSLRDIYEEIDGEMFYQINRSEIVNRQYVQKFSTHIKNRLKIALTNAEVLYSANSRTPGFRKWIKS